MATKKIGRNKIGCANYKTQNKRLRNKVRRIERHLKRQPQDAEASDAMHRIKKLRDVTPRYGFSASAKPGW